MKQMIHKAIKASLLGLMISGTAMASGALTPVGTLQAGANAKIQNELGSFPVSGAYTVLTGDQIKFGENDANATLAMDIGTLYIRPNSSLVLSKSNGTYTVALVSGSIGYELNGEDALIITSSGKEITPIATDGASSGAVAFGPDGSLVVIPVLGDATAVAADGIVTTIAQGYTWSDAEQGAELTLTQVQDATGGMSMGMKVLIGVGVAAGGYYIYDTIKADDQKSKSPSS